MNTHKIETIYSLAEHQQPTVDVFQVASLALERVKQFPLQYVAHTVTVIPMDDSLVTITELRTLHPQSAPLLAAVTGGYVKEEHKDSNNAQGLLCNYEEAELKLEYTLLHSIMLKSSFGFPHDDFDGPVGALVLRKAYAFYEALPGISGVSESLFGPEVISHMSVNGLFENPQTELLLEATYSHPPWFRQRENQRIVFPGLRTGEFLQLHLLASNHSIQNHNDQEEPSFLAIQKVKIELLELVSYSPSHNSSAMHLSVGRKALNSTIIMEKDCFEPLRFKKFDRSPFHPVSSWEYLVPEEIFDYSIPPSRPTTFCNKYSRQYAIQVSITFRNPNFILPQSLQVTLDISMARADNECLKGILQQASATQPSWKETSISKLGQIFATDICHLNVFSPIHVGKNYKRPLTAQKARVVVWSWSTQIKKDVAYSRGYIALDENFVPLSCIRVSFQSSGDTYRRVMLLKRIKGPAMYSAQFSFLERKGRPKDWGLWVTSLRGPEQLRSLSMHKGEQRFLSLLPPSQSSHSKALFFHKNPNLLLSYKLRLREKKIDMQNDQFVVIRGMHIWRFIEISLEIPNHFCFPGKALTDTPLFDTGAIEVSLVHTWYTFDGMENVWVEKSSKRSISRHYEQHEIFWRDFKLDAVSNRLSLVFPNTWYNGLLESLHVTEHSPHCQDHFKVCADVLLIRRRPRFTHEDEIRLHGSLDVLIGFDPEMDGR